MSEKIDKLLRALHKANAITVNKSPLLTTWQEAVVEGQPDNQILYFSWADDAGDAYSVSITEGDFENAVVKEHAISCADHEGDPAIINLYNLVPVLIGADSPVCVWKYHQGHGGEWSTSCGEVYDADDFGCKEITQCPNCKLPTLEEC
jgi:hypothetical protein